MFKKSRRGREARNFTTNVPKVLNLKLSSEQIFPKIDVRCPLPVVAVSIGNKAMVQTLA